MAGFISRQPNGLYCRFSTVVDCPTHWNMTREDYLSNITGTVRDRESGQNILDNHLFDFSEVMQYFVPNNMTQESFEQLLITMGKEI